MDFQTGKVGRGQEGSPLVVHPYLNSRSLQTQLLFRESAMYTSYLLVSHRAQTLQL